MKYNWFQKLLLKVFFKNVKVQYDKPSKALWKLIDNENKKHEPNCCYIEAWLYAIDNLVD